MNRPAPAQRGFTLIELMSALLIVSLLAVMAFRGLGAVLEARDLVARETAKWRAAEAFFARFRRDALLSSPLPLLTGPGRLEFSRFAAAEGIDTPRRVAYLLNANREIELRLWPDATAAPDAPPAQYPVLRAVAQFELRYLDARLAWVEAWPPTPQDAPLPRAVRVRVVLESGEELVRVFALQS